MGLSTDECHKRHLIRPLDLVQSWSCVQRVLVTTERVTLTRALFGSHKSQRAPSGFSLGATPERRAQWIQMNLSSRTAAGRSRSADGDVFLRPNVVHVTGNEPSAQQVASPHAWKRVLQERIWSQNGPKSLAARSILTLLLWYADANGRVWLGIQAIASKVGAGSLRTVRNALDSLARDGWLRSTSQTWASLTAEQTAAGRPVPRRGDVGQAPNLYVLLDGCGQFASSGDVSTPGQIGQGGPLRKCRGEPPANLHHDPDPNGSRSRIKSAEPSRQVNTNTHHFSKVHDKERAWLPTWNVIVEVHTDKTKSVYGLPPLPPDVKRAEQQALAECLEGAASDVRAKIHERTGVEREVSDVQRELATRVMQLYFKRDNEHLRRVKHALRDLPREFHARVTEAMQLLLRESHDAQKPRQMPPEPKVVETNAPTERPTSAPTSKPVQAITAREARRLLDALSVPQVREEPTKQASTEYTQSTQPKRVEPVRLEQPRQDKPSEQDKPTPNPLTAARAGAPRWGATSPRPVKMRRLMNEPADEHEGEVAS